MLARALVTNMEERAALAACRGLHAAGYSVVGGASSRLAAGLWSRTCERASLPDPESEEERFASAVDDLVASRDIDVVVPSTDASLLALAGSADRRVPGLPPREVVQRSLDKIELARAAEHVGLGVPESAVCERPDQAPEIARSLGFPLLVKPTETVTGPAGSRKRHPAELVRDEKGLRHALATVGTPVLLQRFERGATVFSFGGVVAGGRLLGSAYSRYLRTWRPAAGSASYSETIEPPPGLDEQVLALVVELGWEGIFELELVGDDRPRHAIDFNPRPYGSMALAISAGVNLPALWCDAFLGRDSAPARSRAGCRYRFEEADARHLVWQAMRGRPRAALAVFVPRRRTTHAFLRLADPLPAGVEALRLPCRLVSRAIRGHLGDDGLPSTGLRSQRAL